MDAPQMNEFLRKPKIPCIGAYKMYEGVFMSENKKGLWKDEEERSPVGQKDEDVIFPWCQPQKLPCYL